MLQSKGSDVSAERSIPFCRTVRPPETEGKTRDSLTLEQPLDAPGCVLAGGEVNSSGSVIKSFGKYKKKVGDSAPRTTYYIPPYNFQLKGTDISFEKYRCFK